jgi:hypothetical protein
LEIQAEATTGKRYVKPDVARPVMATYILDGECTLLVDLPRGTSKAVSLSNIYDVETIHATCNTERDKLVLPREVVGMLSDWRAGAEGKGITEIDFRWEDPVHHLPSLVVGNSTGNGLVGDSRRSVSRPAIGQCPFRLPDGFAFANARPAADDGLAGDDLADDGLAGDEQTPKLSQAGSATP